MTESFLRIPIKWRPQKIVNKRFNFSFSVGLLDFASSRYSGQTSFENGKIVCRRNLKKCPKGQDLLKTWA